MFIIKCNKIYILQQYDRRMIVVELRGVHIYDGVCLLKYCAYSTTVRDRG